MKRRKKTNIQRVVLFRIVVAYLLICISIYLLFVKTCNKYKFDKDYKKISLDNILKKERLSNEDYNIIFMQTGLGKSAVDKIYSENKSAREIILKYQDRMFNETKTVCKPLKFFLTCEDHITDENNNEIEAPDFVDLRPGDIIISMATHTLGWYHGHVGIILNENRVLESFSIGTVASVNNVSVWKRYTNYAVLRVKNVPDEVKNEVMSNKVNELVGSPYKVTAGVFEDKMQCIDDKDFGTYCSYLPWYIWNRYGIDLDSDGGKIITPEDILMSDKVEVVQTFGINPKIFTD